LGANPAALDLDPEGHWKRKGAKKGGRKGGGEGGTTATAAQEALVKAAEERLRKQVLKVGG